MELTPELLSNSFVIVLISYIIAFGFQLYMMYLNIKQSKVNNQMAELIKEVKAQANTDSIKQKNNWNKVFSAKYCHDNIGYYGGTNYYDEIFLKQRLSDASQKCFPIPYKAILFGCKSDFDQHQMLNVLIRRLTVSS